MEEVDVDFGPVKYGNRAAFYRRYDDVDMMSIKFDSKQYEDDDNVHEFIHALKAGDGSRSGYSATQSGGKAGHSTMIFS